MERKKVVRVGIAVPGYEQVNTEKHGAALFFNGEGLFPEELADALVAEGHAKFPPSLIISVPERADSGAED